jgi:hypothetical protein
MMVIQRLGKMRAAPASSQANIIQWPPHPVIPRQVAPQPTTPLLGEMVARNYC